MVLVLVVVVSLDHVSIKAGPHVGPGISTSVSTSATDGQKIMVVYCTYLVLWDSLVDMGLGVGLELG